VANPTDAPSQEINFLGRLEEEDRIIETVQRRSKDKGRKPGCLRSKKARAKDP
jgi:hypothetical protein